MGFGYTRADFTVGQKVYFGRAKGQQTLGIIAKLNPAKAKVRTLETRGHRSTSGEEWGVPYSLMRPADTDAKPGTPAPPVPKQKLTYNPFGGIENLILEALLSVYSGLSPENLTADGELPFTAVRQRKAELDRQLRGLTLALGREVDELEVYDWYESKRTYERDRSKTGS